MSSTAELTYINHIVKDYFNSILIIDDELDLNVRIVVEETIDAVISNIDLGAVDPALLVVSEEEKEYFKASMDESAAAAAPAVHEKKYSLQPEAAIHVQLMEEGFVTTPFKYDSTIDVAQVEVVLATLLSTIKLLIVDWDLENSQINAVEPGTAASAILHKYASFGKGLKCAVIYTASDDFDGIMDYLSENNLITKRNGYFFENISDSGHKLFGFIISKNQFKPREIIPIISQKLLADKSLVLHFMDTASRINNNISRAMLEFSSPFEKVIFSQILTAKIQENEIARFLTDKFLGLVMEGDHEDYKYNFVIENKINRLKNVTKIQIDGFSFDKMVKLILEIGSDKTKKPLINLFRNSVFVSQLAKTVQDHQQGLQELEEKIIALVDNSELHKDVFLIVMLWDEFLNEKSDNSLQTDITTSLTLCPLNEVNLNDISNFFSLKLSGQFKKFILENNLTPIIEELLLSGEGKSYDNFKNEFLNKINGSDIEKEKLLELLVLWPAYFGDESEFSISYKKQIYSFTKLMKFNESKNDQIETGSIYRKVENDTYLLCITPYCDTFNTSKVERNLKFLVGRIEPNSGESNLKNSDSPNCFYMAVPFPEEKKVKIIKWNFYEVITLHEDDVKLDNMKKMLYLRKEYIQNVMNRYIAYQSRAGVDELFFKESSYINNFKNFL